MTGRWGYRLSLDGSKARVRLLCIQRVKAYQATDLWIAARMWWQGPAWIPVRILILPRCGSRQSRHNAKAPLREGLAP